MSVEKLRAHRPLPWLPNEREEKMLGTARVQMGCPEQGEDLIHRYRQIIAGTSPGGWTERDMLSGFQFEWALADLIACMNCSATEFERIKPKNWRDTDGEPIEVLKWPECRTVGGLGWYKDLHRKRTNEAGKPVFINSNCPGPAIRLARIRSRVTRVIT